MTRRKPRSDLGRRVGGREVKRQILVLTEGQATEPGYLAHAARRLRRHLSLTIDSHGGAPKQLVERAIAAKKDDARRARKGRGSVYDEIWCVFDVDEHADLSTAMDLARRHGICVALSNPCIELWFVLHFRDQTAHVARGAVQSDCRGLLQCDKRLPLTALDALDERLADAIQRARALDRKHQGDGSPPGSNPSSGMWKLMESLERATNGE